MKCIVDRRAALQAAGAAMAGSMLARPNRSAAASWSEAPAPAIGDDALVPTGQGVDIRRYASLVVGDDWTAALHAAVSEAAQLDEPRLDRRVHRAVLIPAGTYAISAVEVPRLVKIVGVGADLAYYGDGTRRGGTTLVHTGAASGPMLDVTGPGVTLESLTLDGNGVPSPVLRVTNGFESILRRLRLIRVPGTALEALQLNNNSWDDVFVDDSGSATAAAVVVKSPRAATNTNTVTISRLTIERSANVALDIAWGESRDYYAEFLRFSNLHVEGVRSTSDALVRIGTVRHVEFVSPFIYGGGPAAPLIEYRSRPAVNSGVVALGGVVFLGGMLLGVNGKERVRSASLARLTAGNDAKFIGTRFGNHSAAAVLVASGFGPMLTVDPSCTAFGYLPGPTSAAGWPASGGVPVLLEDHRPVVTPLPEPIPPDPGPTARPGAQNRSARGTAVVGSDSGGVVTFGTASVVAPGEQVRVTFGRRTTSSRAVVLTPASKAAAAVEHWVVSSPSGFTIHFVRAPTRRAAPTTYRFTFTTIET